MLTAEEWPDIIKDVFRIHAQFPREPRKAFRNDGRTPFGTHPVRLMMLFLNEESLPEEKRVIGAKALAGHDFKEDTTLPLRGWPKWAMEYQVYQRICGLTFKKGEDKYVEIWNREENDILLSFYDNVDGLMCTGGISPERMTYKRDRVHAHMLYIEQRYPKLEIIKMAKGLLTNP